MNSPSSPRRRQVRLGLPYLALGGLFLLAALVLAGGPRVFSAAEPEYIVPYACQALECAHGYIEVPGKGLLCAQYPPQDVLDSKRSPSAKRARLVLGAVCGGAGLLCAVITAVSGFLWLSGLWIARGRVGRLETLCRAAPVLVIVFWVMACLCRAIYPITPI